MRRWIAACAVWLVMVIPACEQRPIEPGLETTNIPWRIAHLYEQQPFLFTVWMVSSNNIIAGSPSRAYRIDYYMRNSQPAIIHYDGGGWNKMDFVYSEDSIGLSIWGTAPGNIFAAEGMLHHFDGTTWTETGLPAYVVGGNEDGDIFAASQDTIYQYDGQDWQPFYEKAGETSPPHAIWVGHGPTVAVAWRREIVLWDGAQWRTQELASITDLWGTSIDNLYAVGGKLNFDFSEGGIWHFDGIDWAPVPMEDFVWPLYGIWGTAHDNIYAVGEYGFMLHYNGIDWEEIEKTTVQALYDIHGSGPDDICAVGEINRALRYDGSSWDTISEVTPARALRVWAESPSRMIVWYSDRGYFRFEDGKWLEEYASFISLMRIEDAFAGTAMDDLYASYDGSIYHFDGMNWTLSADSLQDIYSFYIAAPDDIFAVGDGTLYRFDGIRWNIMMEGFLIRFYAVWGSSADNVFAAGDNGVILHFDGQSWKLQARDTGGRIYDIWGASADDVYAAGDAGVLHYDGKEWTPHPGLEKRSMRWIAGSSANNIVAVGYDGLYHFDGLMWRRDESISSRILHVTPALDGSIVLVTDDAIMYITE
jgi:hypothetical protein